jgi:hypothetical protein
VKGFEQRDESRLKRKRRKKEQPKLGEWKRPRLKMLM